MKELKPHQISGAIWLSMKRHALLADEMRVGKTLTALYAAKIVRVGRILIVCPAVARRVWAVGVSECLGRAATVVTTGGELLGVQKSFSMAQTVITSYDLMPDKEAMPWDLVILDECHYLKSTTAQRAQGALGRGGLAHRAGRVWALSGTPAPNYAAEMWPLLRTFGAYAGAYEEFVREFCTGYLGPYGFVITGSKNPEKLRELLAPIMLRRTLAEVAPELPPIEFSDYPLDGVQVQLPPREVSLVGKALADGDSLEEIEPAVATLRRLTGIAKVPAALELILAELEAGSHKLVIFAVHREVVGLLAEGLTAFNPGAIIGGVSNTARDAAIHKFQTDPKYRVMICNIQAGGTAWDASAASECVFVESSWVPGENAQAAMRLQNMNRTGQVTARFLSAGGTIDERIQRVLARKAADLTDIFD